MAPIVLLDEVATNLQSLKKGEKKKQTRQAHRHMLLLCMFIYQLCAPQIRCIIYPVLRPPVDHPKGPLCFYILTCHSESLGVCESWRQSKNWRLSDGYDCHEDGSK